MIPTSRSCSCTSAAGGYFVEEFLDLNGAMLRLGTVESNLSARPFRTLAPAILDALDAEDQED
ncbi:hypothetical protein OG842_11860 [Streptomyces sp. NBC_00376]|uniref:hypothetical protein n=1 Tax=Streptomyces sp. NBC_00376 TaxID=2975730 RepID=UPI002E20E345